MACDPTGRYPTALLPVRDHQRDVVGRLVGDYASVGKWLELSRVLTDEESIRPPAFVPSAVGACA